MTDAEIKELAIKHGLSFAHFHEAQKNIIAFAKELEAITREKVLDELVKDNPAVKFEPLWCEGCSPDNCTGCVTPIAEMPPVPEGWQLVPIEPTDEMINAYIDSPDMENWKLDFIGGYKAMLEAAPKKG